MASVWFLRSKSQDELDKKANNHLPLPMDYASNEGKLNNKKELWALPSHFISLNIMYTVHPTKIHLGVFRCDLLLDDFI